ncbi:MAG: MBL fold metallo-hydrolase [Phycisphaerae bacterium]|nr:MBL fold metallo-hydrolase [Phycisphaerae bacterium]
MAELYSINTSSFRLDGGAMHGVVPKVLWQKQCPPDDKNRVLLAVRVLLIIDGDRKILVDTGIGNYHNEKFNKIYCLGQPDFDFNQALKPYGLTPGEITDIIITHLHFDHAGGLITQTDEGIAPTFYNADIYVQAEHWQWALAPSPKDRASFLPVYMDWLRDNPKLKLLNGAVDVSPDVSVEPTSGHTPAMQTVLTRTDEGICYFPSDTISTAALLHIPFITAYDNNAVLTAQEKMEILPRACQENWMIYFQHDPVHERGQVVKNEDKYTLK